MSDQMEDEEHEPDCDCIYCQLDRMQERADERIRDREDREEGAR